MADLTDLEIVRRCAEAMGYEIDYSSTNGGGARNTGFDISGAAVLDWHNGIKFNPLHDKAQAMELFIAFPVECLPAMQDYARAHLEEKPFDLCRAICLCVAKMKD